MDPMSIARSCAPMLHFHPDEAQFCCFPSSAEAALDLARMWRVGEHRAPKTLTPPPPAYVQAGIDQGQLTRLKFWFWYRFNDFPQGPGPIGSHPGDWESVEV